MAELKKCCCGKYTNIRPCDNMVDGTKPKIRSKIAEYLIAIIHKIDKWFN